MKDKDLIKFFYFLSLMEEEGLGTTYEYFVRWKLINNLFGNKKIKNILIFGLPEKYGFGLDFIFFGVCKKSKIVIVDDRKEKLKKLEKIFFSLKETFDIKPKFKLKKLLSFNSIKFKKRFDILLSAEVFQRLDCNNKLNYLEYAKKVAKECSFFVPNGNNKAHEKISKLNSISLCEFISYFKKCKIGIKNTGYIDMPPFLPGLKQKKKINSGVNMYLLKFLEKYFLIEKIAPLKVKRKFAHTIYISI